MNKRSKLPLRFLAAAILLSITAYVLLNFYLTHIWYDAPDYQISVLNSTSNNFQDVRLTLSPQGSIGPMWLDSGQVDRHMDPSWPIPTRIDLRFSDMISTRFYHDTLVVDNVASFKGDLQVEIKGTSGSYTCVLNAIPENED